jgi:Flp pilus assembly protein TadB
MSQPRGTPDRPASALNLRLTLALIGLVAWAVLAVLAWRAGLTGVAVFSVLLVFVAAVDLLVVQRRRRQRRRTEGDTDHTLFE